MIATLEGLVRETTLGTIVLDVASVGYGLFVTHEDLAQFVIDQKAKLYIYEYIREQSHDLYGFVQRDTKVLFEQLLSVKNVGPKVALSVLDIGSTSMVREAIASGDVKQLQAAKGVGKRAAEQIVVELRDKVGRLSTGSAEDIVHRPGIQAQDEAVEALVSLGYTPQDALTALYKIDPKLPVEERVRLALKG